MATTPSMHSRRDASSPTGVPSSYVPFSDGTQGRIRTGASALTAIGPLNRPLIFLFLALTFLFAVAACATADNPAGSERASSGAPLALLPNNTTRLELLDVSAILGGSTPESFETLFESQWEPYSLGDDIVTIDDIDSLVRAVTRDGQILMLSGSQIDFAGVRDWLDSEEANIEGTSYQGQELWGDDFLAMTLVDGYLIVGDTEALKEVLKVKARGTGSLGQDSESSLKKAYDDARAGWYVMASENCDEFPSGLRACEAYSISGGQGQEDYLVDVTYRFQFRSEQRAESQALDIEDWLDDRNWDIDLDEVKADGTSVEVRSSGDEEDFRLDWLVTYSGVRTPLPLPTAVPEPATGTLEPTRTTSSSARNATSVVPTRSRRAMAPPAPTEAPAATLVPVPTPTLGNPARTEVWDECLTKMTSVGSVNGQWNRNCLSENLGGLAYFYTFSLSYGNNVVIELEVHDDSFRQASLLLLEGEGSSGRVIAEGASRVYGSTLEAVLPSGAYTIEAVSHIISEESQPYTLTLLLP